MSQGQLLRRKSSQKIDALSQQVREFLTHHPRTSIKDEYQDQEHALFLKVVPDHMKASADIARRFQDIYESTKNNEDVTDYEERLDKILQVAKGLVKTEGLDMVQHSLSCFVKHNPELKRDVLIPQFEFRRPDLITPTAIKVDPRDYPENKLDWWRLDPSIADHHDHWHQVYPMFYSDKLPKAKPRQGEMFYYVHEQMLARYDADRLGVGLPPVKPLNDYHAPIPEAFHRPQRAGLSRAREANMKFKDVRWPKTIGAQANFQADQVVTIKQFEVMRDRLMEAIKQGKLKNPPGVEPEYVEMTDWNLGETHEADVASVNTTYYDADDLDPDGNKTAGHHSTGHMMVANVHFNDSAPSLKDIGTIADHSTAPRDPVFYRWHKHVDEFWLAWQDRKPKYNTQTFLDDNAKISIRPQDIIVVFRDRIVDNKGDLDAWGKWKFAETPQDWGTDFSRFGLGTNEFQTEMQIRTVSGTSKDQQADWNEDMWKVPYLTHRGFVWFLRLENNTHQVQTGTARIWMCPIETAENRRSWIEMDKFKVIIPPKQKQVFARPDFLSSVIRKPTLPFADTGPIGAGADPYGPENNKDDDFCDCGWPYHMLLPRGTRTGMKFKLMVIITNGHDLLIENNECCCSLGSISYCGTSGRKEYPDTKPMGYPFDRQFEESIQQTFAGLESVATREITIRRIDNYYGPEEQETQGSVPEPTPTPTPTPVPAPAPASSSSLEERGLVTSMKTVTPKGAQLLIELGKKKAAELNVKPCFAVVDRFGNLLAFHREDNSVNDLIINLAISKARTAVCVRNSTQAFADLISPQGDHWGVNPANSGMVTLGGGEVVKVNGELVGGFGVSAGGNWGNDSAISKAAVDGFTSSS